MKKIVSAAVAASMLAGAAFADVSFSATGKNYFQAGQNGTTANTAAKAGDSLYYSAADHNDCVSITAASSDRAHGASLDVDFNNNGIQLDQMYAWMTFSKISTQFTAGIWNSRYVDRVTTDKRGVDFDREDFELYKPGIIAPLNDADFAHATDDATLIRANRRHNVGIDSDNLTRGNLAMMAAFTPSFVPGLMIKAGLVDVTGKARSVADGAEVSPFAYYLTDASKADSASNRTYAWSSSNTRGSASDEYKAVNVLAGFVGEVAFRQDGLFNLNLAVRSFYDHTASAALFFSPLMVENLEATAGVTLGFNGAGWISNDITGYNGMKLQNDMIHKAQGTVGVEWAADLRLRYAFSDRLSFTTMHNFSSYLSTLQIQEDGHGNTAGYQDETKWSKNDYAMWNMVNLTWNLDDNLVAGFTVQHLNRDMDQMYTLNNDLWFSPSLTITPTEKFNVTVVTRMHWQNFGADEDHAGGCTVPGCTHNHAPKVTDVDKFEIKIPVILTFNY